MSAASETTNDPLTTACELAHKENAVLERRIRTSIGTARTLLCLAVLATGTAGRLFDFKTLELVPALCGAGAILSLASAVWGAAPYALFAARKTLLDDNKHDLTPGAQMLLRAAQDPKTELERLASLNWELQKLLDNRNSAVTFSWAALVAAAVAYLFVV